MKFPAGFVGAGIEAGIKSSGAKDLALIVNTGPVKFGTAVFTSNQIVAAPVIWSREVVQDNEVSAVILNSGGANACTGPAGFADVHQTAEQVAAQLNISASDVAVCSTGLIGTRLPMAKISEGITSITPLLSSESLSDVAAAILTTDSKPKISEFNEDFHFVGIAKGAGMLAPSLATMLSVVMTDAEVSPSEASEIFQEVVDETFNRIDSDGCTSTNDTVLFLASGEKGERISSEELRKSLKKICSDLALQLVADAEGHTKIIKITTVGAKTERDAIAVGRACARNNLLKCALHGEDPNWGRILAALGTTTAVMDPLKIDITMNGVKVCIDSAPGEPREQVNLKNEEIHIEINLKSGVAEATIWTNDLSAMYVHENSAYAT